MHQKMIDELNQRILHDYDNTTGIIVMKKGKMYYENYFNEASVNSSMHIFSVTKSIVSICIGIAIDKGYITGVQEKVLNYFPDYKIKKAEKTIQNVTLENLLTMTAPYKYIFAPYTKHFSSEDWVKSSLDYLGGKKAIGTFRYTPMIGPDILTGILTRATGQSVYDFAKKHLFEPLGIKVEKTMMLKDKDEHMKFHKAKEISVWIMDEQGTNTAGWGLSLSTRDMAKIGQLYLNEGVWENKQIVSSNWIKESTSEHSRWEKQNLGYGYLWWITKNGFAAVGDGGNVIYCNKEKELVIAITGYFKPRCKDRIDLIEKYIEPLFIE